MNAQAANHRILAKLIYLLKRFTDDWLDSSLCCGGNTEFNNSHLPLLATIGRTGCTNNELAEKLNVTKQSTSKSIKTLEAIGLVRSEKSTSDARAVMIYLTDDGERLYDHIKQQIMALEEEYKKIVGAKNYETAVDVMLKLIDFHEHQKRSC